MILAALILATGLVIFGLIEAKSKEKYHLKPKLAAHEVVILGVTQDGENMQIVTKLLDEETPAQHAAKLAYAFKMREDRLQFQNERMQRIEKEAKENFEKAKAEGKITNIKG